MPLEPLKSAYRNTTDTPVSIAGFRIISLAKVPKSGGVFEFTGGLQLPESHPADKVPSLSIEGYDGFSVVISLQWPILLGAGEQLGVILQSSLLSEGSQVFFVLAPVSPESFTPAGNAAPAAHPQAGSGGSSGELFEVGGRCSFDSLIGECSQSVPCPAHAGVGCSKCGEVAVRECFVDLGQGVYCGEPLCGKCGHTSNLSGPVLLSYQGDVLARSQAAQILDSLEVSALISSAGIDGIQAFRVSGVLSQVLEDAAGALGGYSGGPTVGGAAASGAV